MDVIGILCLLLGGFFWGIYYKDVTEELISFKGHLEAYFLKFPAIFFTALGILMFVILDTIKYWRN